MKMKNQISQISLILALAAAFILLAVFPAVDLEIVNALQAMRNAPLDFIMLAITSIGHWAVTSLFILVFFYAVRENRKNFLLVLGSFLLTFLIAVLLKFLIFKPRPFEVLGLEKSESFSGIVSGHTAAAFAPFVFLRGRFRIFWLLFALLVAFSRIYLAAHFLSDVILGALIGYVSGLIFSNLKFLRVGRRAEEGSQRIKRIKEQKHGKRKRKGTRK